MQTLPQKSDLIALAPYLTKRELDELLHQAASIERDLKTWKPLPGPQTQAFNSEADILFYGGAAGGGKSSLLLGLAHLSHSHSIIFRRQYPQLEGLIKDSEKIFSEIGFYHSTKMVWRLNDKRYIEFGAVKDEKDKEKFQGRAHDLCAFDELTHFTRSQFQFLTAWNRSIDPNQRCRIVCTGNPPTTAEGDWVIDFWGPWLDEKHPKPAAPGELRWYTNIDGVEIECVNGDTFTHNGDNITPKSRTFIPASIDDNPYLRDSGYKSTLQSLPRELREKLLHGNFTSSREDDPWQVIPSDWVMAAQQRWRERPQPQIPITVIGVDVARGGIDQTVLTLRYANWFAPQKIFPGSSTPDGPAVAALVLNELKHSGTIVNIDIIGVGTSPYDCLKVYKSNVYPMNSANKSEEKDKSGLFTFINKRSEWWWKLREALDPEHGDDLALPPGRELLADLTAGRYEIGIRGIQVEPKADIKARIGRSPDFGDSLVYSIAIGKSSFAFGAI